MSVSCIIDQKVHFESFSECSGVSKVMKVGWKFSRWLDRSRKNPFSKSSSCSWQNINQWATWPQLVSATGCRNYGYSLTGIVVLVW